MNHARHPLDNKTRKKMEKEVKKGQEELSEVVEPLRTDKMKPKDILDKYPPKVQKAEKGSLKKLQKDIDIKAKKKEAPHSKRTTPGDVEEFDATPAHVKKEGARWNKTLVAQNKTHSKELTAKVQRRTSKRGDR